MKNNINLYIVILFLFLFKGCAPAIAPEGYLPTSAETQSDTFGGWIKVQCESRIISGELIAIDSDFLYILSEDYSVESINRNYTHLHIVSKYEVESMRLDRYDSKAGDMFGWSIYGAISTLSHGFFLFFSAPTWIVFGSINSSAQSKKPLIEYPEKSFEYFVPYSRFPQGIPADLNQNTLKSKLSILVNKNDVINKNDVKSEGGLPIVFFLILALSSFGLLI